MRALNVALGVAVVTMWLGFAGAAGAMPFEIGSSTVDANQGNYFGQSFTVDNDPVLSGTNSCSVGNCFLLEWSWQVNDPNTINGTSPGPLFIDIYDIDGAPLYLGSSNNSIDIQSTASSGDVLTWTFDPLLVDPTHPLVAEISTDGIAGSAGVIRLDVAVDNVSGTLVVMNATPADTGFDSIYSGVFVPEPGTFTLLSLGMVGIAVMGRRRKLAA